MKVIGFTYNGSSPTYLMEVNHSELEEFTNKLYAQEKEERLFPLKIGDEFDLGEGYDFHGKVKDLISDIRPLINKSEKHISTLMNGLKVLSDQVAQRDTSTTGEETK